MMHGQLGFIQLGKRSLSIYAITKRDFAQILKLSKTLK